MSENLFEPPYIYKGYVHRVVDGDTAEISIDVGFGVILKSRKVRLLGLNAPERYTATGPAATAGLRELIHQFGCVDPDHPDDVLVLLATKLDKNDKYGRILARLRGFDRKQGWLPIDINHEMIVRGFAIPMGE